MKVTTTGPSATAWLRMESRTVWRDCLEDVRADGEELADAALRNLQARLASLAASATPRSLAQSSLTVAASRERLPQVLQCIQRFQHELSMMLESDVQRDSVYHLEVLLFPPAGDRVPGQETAAPRLDGSFPPPKE